jgi:hypothetical protein
MTVHASHDSPPAVYDKIKHDCSVLYVDYYGTGLKISTKFQNFVNFGNFGGGRKKNPKFCNTLIHVLCNSRLIFSMFILHISSIQ